MSFASQVRATTPSTPKILSIYTLQSTTFLSWPASGQLSFCIGQPLANYLFALASLWPTIFLHWPAFGQLSFYIGQPLACSFLYGNLLRNITNDRM